MMYKLYRVENRGSQQHKEVFVGQEKSVFKLMDLLCKLFGQVPVMTYDETGYRLFATINNKEFEIIEDDSYYMSNR